MRILIIRFSSIGDIVLTTPVMRCLNNQIPGAEIHFLTKKAFVPILNNNPYISKVWEWDDNEASKILTELKKLKFDFIADLHHNLRSLRVKRALGRPGASFNKLNIEKFLLVNFKINRLPDIHIVDRYLQTVASLGVKNDNKGLDYFIHPEDEFNIKNLPESHQEGYIALVPGALQATKKLPTEKFFELCAAISFPVLVLGGKAEENIGNTLEEKFPHVINYCGKLNLGGSASLIRQASAVITHDTGLMHIAAAFRKPIISIWGNTVPQFGMYPYLPEHNSLSVIHEVKNLKCRPCSKIGYAECPKKHFNCMNQQDIPQIAQDALLAATKLPLSES
ncbi:MAG: glycosyltransferase family 9 protein [Bacteroidia bacterium]